MNEYEMCYRTRHGEQGKRKRKLTNYCNEGYLTDSQTGERLTKERCLEWAHRCKFLRPRKKSAIWEPSWRGNLI